MTHFFEVFLKQQRSRERDGETFLRRRSQITRQFTAVAIM